MPTIVRRVEIPPVNVVEVNGSQHSLGELKDFRAHQTLKGFLRPDMKLSMSWVRLQPGEVLEPHVHPVDSMIIVAHGNGVSLGDLRVELTDGDIFMVPSGHAHGFKGVGPEGFWALSIQFEERSLYEKLDEPLVHFVRGQGNGHGGHGKETASTRPTPQHEELVERLLRENVGYVDRWRKLDIFRAVEAGKLDAPGPRGRFLSCLQTWSNQFQRLVMARAAFCDDSAFRALADGHLIEEFGHHRMLADDRGDSSAMWDPVLDSCSEWFVAKMLSLDNVERTVLVHLVLETAAVVAYPILGRILPRKPQQASHFGAHADGFADEQHVQMGVDLLRQMPLKDFSRLEQVLRKSWEIMYAMFDRIGELSLASGAPGESGEAGRP